MKTILLTAVGGLLVSSCESQPPRPPANESESTTQAIAPADSLAMVHPSGAEIWFREGRIAVAPDGQGTCYERTLEIRREKARHRVPLLYTLAAPVAIDDSSIKAVVYLNCQPQDQYRISLNTGRPTPIVP